MILSLNHGAKGVTYWIYPSSEEINVLSGEIGTVLDSEVAKEFIFGTEPINGLKVEGGEVRPISLKHSGELGSREQRKDMSLEVK